jgi:excisionase family DNA binding protein
MEAIYTIKETVQILKVNRSQVLRWIYSGQLKAFKLGGGRLWRIRERDLKRFIGGKSDAPMHSVNGIAPAESKSF